MDRATLDRASGLYGDIDFFERSIADIKNVSEAKKISGSIEGYQESGYSHGTIRIPEQLLEGFLTQIREFYGEKLIPLKKEFEEL